MYTTDDLVLGQSLERARKVCKAIRAIFGVAIVLYALSLIISLVGVFLSGQNADAIGTAFTVIYVGLHGAVIVWFLYIMMKIFSDVVNGNPPFSEIQANRMRLISLLALAYVILELVFTATVSYSVVPEVGYNIGINDAYPTDSINLNVGMLVFSAIMYSLSALFRYAALLQQLSQDTV